LSFMPSFGFAITLMAVVGRAIGAGDPELASRQTYRALCATIIYMGCIGFMFLIFRNHLIGLFTDSPHIIAIGSHILILVAIFQIFDASQMVFVHALRGAGDTKWPAKVSGILCATLFLGGGYTVAKFFPQFQSLGPWGMATIYMITLGCIMALRWSFGPWRKMTIFQS
ncbi:MAG: MATE family efflux transporter, partial [Chthoniobacterales bacterium]